MRSLRERIEGLIEGPTSELLLRLRIILVTWQVDLVAARAEQRRGKLLRNCAEQVDGEVDRRGRRDAQLACGRLVRVCCPWCRFGACDVLRVCLGDDRCMPGRIDFLRGLSIQRAGTPVISEKATYDENVNSALFWIGDIRLNSDNKTMEGTHCTSVSYDVRDVVWCIDRRCAVSAILGDVCEAWDDEGETLAVDNVPVERIDLQ